MVAPAPGPADPRTINSPPVMPRLKPSGAAPARAPTSPSITRVPPASASPASFPRLLSTTTLTFGHPGSQPVGHGEITGKPNSSLRLALELEHLAQRYRSIAFEIDPALCQVSRRERGHEPASTSAKSARCCRGDRSRATMPSLTIVTPVMISRR